MRRSTTGLPPTLLHPRVETTLRTHSRRSGSSILVPEFRVPVPEFRVPECVDPSGVSPGYPTRGIAPGLGFGVWGLGLRVYLGLRV